MTVTVSVGGRAAVIDVIRALDAAGVDAVDLNRRQATLDDVFLTLTEPGSGGSGHARADRADVQPDHDHADRDEVSA